MPGIAAELAPRRDVPHPDELVAGGGDEQPLGREGERVDGKAIAGQGRGGAGIVEAPQQDAPVIVAAGEQPAIRGEGDGVDIGGVLAEHPGSAAGDGPEAQAAVPAGRSDGGAVGRDRERRDLAAMAEPACGDRAGVEVPEDQAAVIAGRDRAMPVGQEGDGIDRGVMAGEPQQRTLRREVPQHDAVIEAGGQHAPAIGADGDAFHRAAMADERGKTRRRRGKESESEEKPREPHRPTRAIFPRGHRPDGRHGVVAGRRGVRCLRQRIAGRKMRNCGDERRPSRRRRSGC